MTTNVYATSGNYKQNIIGNSSTAYINHQSDPQNINKKLQNKHIDISTGFI